MLHQEYFRTRGDGVVLTRTWSDAGFKIRQIETDILYDEAIDIEPLRYTYEETDIPIEEEEEENNAEKQDL